MYRLTFFSILFLSFNSIADSTQLRDPTTPIFVSKSRLSSELFKLQAVIEKRGEKLAIINGKTLRVGDRFSSLVVTNIDDKSVTYKKNGKYFVLDLRPKIFDRKNKE